MTAQPLPSLQGEGLGVGSVTISRVGVCIFFRRKKLETPPLAPPLEGRGVAAPSSPSDREPSPPICAVIPVADRAPSSPSDRAPATPPLRGGREGFTRRGLR